MLDPYRVIGWAWLVILVIWIAASFSNKDTVRRQPARSRAIQACLGITGGIVIWGGWPIEMIEGPLLIPRSEATADLALGLTLLGLALALWARFVLGRNWSAAVTVKREHQLIRSGPYQVVRHPIYTGFLVALLGTAMARGSVGAFCGLALVFLAIYLKTKMEERFMIEQFGSEYQVYRRDVKALIPFVW